MKTFKTLFFMFVLTSGLALQTCYVMAQCPTINCPSNITVNNDSGACSAVVTFTAPIGTNPCGKDTLEFTGGMQTWTVPAGITSITVEAFGAQGATGERGNYDGGDFGTYGGTGGLGAYASGLLSVTPGQTINIFVGGQSGWNGGGITGTGWGADGGNGGGASDIRIGGTALANRVLVAAGGGGGGGGAANTLCSPGIPSDGGAGSGGGSNLDGGTGTSGGSGPGVGIGGYANGLGGAGGLGNQPGTAGGNGVLGIGGNGGSTTFPHPPYSAGVAGQGGGGGGGYNGGGGGGASGFNGGCGAPGGGGAGGSSYVLGVTDSATTASVKTGDGRIIITYSVGIVTTTLTAGLPSGSVFPVGTTIQQFTVTDQLLNEDSCSFTITVIDNEPPTFKCPSDVIICKGDPISIPPADIQDNCGGTVTVTYALTGATTAVGSNDASSVPFNNGVTTVTYTFTDTHGNSDVCSFDVTVVTVDTSLTVTDPIITANSTSATYQWLDCNNAFAVISGATLQSYTATANGSYAVEVTQGLCTDTSNCVQIITISVHSALPVDEGISVYPNPVSGELFIEMAGNEELVNFEILNTIGQKVYTGNMRKKSVINMNEFTPGVYYIRAMFGDSSVIKKVVKL